MSSKTIKIPARMKRKKLMEAYRAIPLSDYRIRLVRKYFLGAASLYGCIPLGCFFQILENLHKGLLTEEEFCAFAAAARGETDGYYIVSVGTEDLEKPEDILSWCLVTPYLLMDTKAWMEVQKGQLRHGRWYVPEKEELLSYADGLYPAEELPLKAFSLFLYAHSMDGKTSVPDILADLEESERYRMGGKEAAMQCLEAAGVNLSSAGAREEWDHLYEELHQHTRMPWLGGATPEEMKNVAPLPERDEEKAPRQSKVFGVENYYDTVFTKLKPKK